jgi:hypothetical protein
MSRILPQSTYLSLKAATRRLIGMAGGVEHAETRVGKSNLSDYGNPFKLEFFAPLDVIADLEASVGEPIVSSVLAQIIEDGKRPAKDETCNPVHLGAEVMVSLGRYSEEAHKAAEDGVVEDHELQKLIKQAEQMRLAANRVHDMLCAEETRRKVKA